jgi:hypothetical protein
MPIPLGIFAIAGAPRGPLAGIAGYFAGGNRLSVDKYLFATDTKSSLTALTTQRNRAASASNSGTAGYGIGGQDASSNYIANSVDKYTYSTDARTTFNPSGVGGITKRLFQGLDNLKTNSFLVGGQVTGGNVQSDTIKFTFSNETTSSSSPTLTRRSYAAASNGTSFGYIMGGATDPFGTSSTSTTNKFTYSGETISTLGTGLSVIRADGAGLSNTGTAAYTAGGENNASGALTSIDKFLYSNDSRTTLAASLAIANFGQTTASNFNTSGYIAGGAASGLIVRKLDFTNDTFLTSPANLTNSSDYGVGLANNG